MSKKLWVAGMVMFSLFTVGSINDVYAGCKQNRVKKYWQKHSAAKQRIMRTWINNRSSNEYAEAIFDIAKYEIYLARNCVRYGHKAFVNRLAGNVKSVYDYPIFAYRVFQYEFNRLMGYEISPDSLFQGQSFEIYKK